ncbi:transcriptional regulator [Klebsiella pneumoniae]|uniref:helix-turn-helix domain-containing protein n=1 Tax=Klebsiella pneumoniae TaxID=573 RepID=UPI0038579CF6
MKSFNTINSFKNNEMKFNEIDGNRKKSMIFALNRRWPKGERLIAEALGVAPETIWPSRYR